MFNRENLRFEKISFHFLFILVAFLPFNLKVNGAVEVVFILTLSLIFLMMFIKNKRVSRIDLAQRGSNLYLLFFISLVFSSFYGVLIKTTSLNEMVIGIIPFLFLGIYWILLFHTKSIKSLQLLCSYIIMSGSIVSAKILSIFILNSIRGEYLSRVTFSYPKSTTPLTMIAGTLSLYFVLSSKKNRTIKVYFILFLMNTLAVFVTFTRSMILTLGASFVIYLVLFIKLRFKIKKKILKRNLLKVTLILIPLFTFYNKQITEVFSLFFIRFTSLSSGLTVDPNSIARLTEIEISYGKFVEQPLLGYGIGYLFQPGASGNLHGYTHNIFSYLIVASGAIGTLIYVVMIAYFYFDHVRLINRTSKVNVELSHFLIATFVCLNILFFYAQFFAVFRTIEYNVLFASTIMIYTKIKTLIKQSEFKEVDHE